MSASIRISILFHLFRFILFHGLVLEVLSTSDASSSSSPASLQQCGVYLAPSTIPGAGLGMFSGRHIKTREQLAPGDSIVPVHDYSTHNPELVHEDYFFSYYGWQVELLQGLWEEGQHTIAWVAGTGAALNCDLPLVNIIGREDRIQLSDSGVHRSDPGAGAFSPFFNRHNMASRDIQPGEELFDSYGDNYFADREEIYGKIPLTDDYDIADKLLKMYKSKRDTMLKRLSRTAGVGEDSKNRVHQDWYSMLTQLSSIWPSRILNALPKDPVAVETFLENDVSTAWTNYNRSIVSLEWLQQNGACMDNIESRPSTIEQAGRGAFARRFIPKGSVVGPAPVLHFDRRLFDMRERQYDEYGNVKVDLTGPVVQKQLVLNYCWGHRFSSLLLCPYGMNVLSINHSRQNPNAMIAWNHTMMMHPEWLKQPLHEWIHTLTAGLYFDIIATKDIEPGQEVFIDYGEEWEAAWKQHVATWKPPRDADIYIPARELNKEKSIRTVAEGSYNYNFVELMCREQFRVWSGLPPSDVYVGHVYWGSMSNEGRSSRPCRAIDRYENNDGEELYTVEVYSRGGEETGVCREWLSEVLLAVPRDVFLFVDEHYTRDHAQPWAFRHDMRIPDDIFPVEWMDLRYYKKGVL